MARLSTYAIDGTPVSSDKLIGTDSAGTVTKNYPLGDVADWLKSSGATAVLGQNNYLFQVALDPEEGRKIGSFSFDRYGGDGTEFSAVTELKFSASSSTGQYIADYLLSTVGQKVLISQLDAPNNFGIYALVSLTQRSLEPTFYDAVLAFVDGNGALQGNESYGLATYSALNEAGGGGTWGSITGDIDNQTDLVNYIDNAIAGVPVPPTPTLQSVTDTGNTTTNIIKTDAGFEAYRVGARRVFLGGTSINGQLLLDSGGTWDVNLTGGSNKYFANGNFGIGTTAPQQKLHVGGVLMAQNIGGSFERSIGLFPGNYEQTLKYSGTGLVIQNSSNDNDLGAGGGNVVVKLSPYATNDRTTTLSLGNKNQQSLVHTSANGLLTINNATSGGVMAFDLNGNVGIGTTAPTEKLHVQGTAPKIKLHNTNGFDTYIEAYTGSGYSGININKNFFINGYNGSTLWSVEGGLIIANQYFYGGYINFRKRGTTVNLAQIGLENGSNTYFNTGNFGIGTTAPVTPLHIGDGGTVTLESSSTTDGKLSFKAANGSEHAFLRRTGSYNLEIYSYGSIKLDSGTSSISFANNGKPVYWNVYNNSNFIFSGYTGFGGEVIMNNRFDGTEVFHAYLSGTYKTTFPNGNVGIGTTAPAYKLDVVGASRIQNELTLGDNTSAVGTLHFKNPGFGSYIQSNGYYIFNTLRGVGNQFRIKHASASSELDMYTLADDGIWHLTPRGPSGSNGSIAIRNPNNSTKFLFNTDSGNLGIGNTSPSEKLHVSGNIIATGGTITAFASNTSKSIISNVAGGGRLQLLSDTGDIYLRTKGGDSYFNAGNVGIGTTAPALQSGGTGLHINAPTSSEIKFTNSTTGTTASDGTALVSNGTGFTINNREAGSLTLGTNNSTRLYIDSAGNVGIGTTVPSEKLHIQGVFGNNTFKVKPNSDHTIIFANQELRVGTTNNADVYITPNGLKRATFKADGSVGIGVGSPTFTLESAANSSGNNLRLRSNSNNGGASIAFSNNDASESWGGLGASYITPGTSIATKLGFSAVNYLGYKTTIATMTTTGLGIATSDVTHRFVVKNIYNNTTSIVQKNSSDAINFAVGNTGANQDGILSLHDGGGTGQVVLNSNGNSYINGGNVGIGTTAPAAKLHVDGYALFGTDTSTGYYFGPANRFSIGGQRVLEKSGASVYVGYNANDLVFRTNNLERGRFNTAGNFGIGTAAPDSKLHVKATSGIAFKVDPNSADKEWYIDTTNPDHLKKKGNLILNADPTNVHASTKISFNIDGSNKASINSDGDLGVGTTAQTSKVHVDGTAMRQLRMGTSGGPSSNTDTSGAIGDMAYDDNYFYIKTINGWGRVALDFGF